MNRGGSRPGFGRREFLSADERLRRRIDFSRCYKNGRRRNGTLASLHLAPNEIGHPRLGITVTRKVGGAVTRVRIKRRIREIYRRWSERDRLPARDIVVHAKPAARQASFQELRTELESLLGALLPSGPGR